MSHLKSILFPKTAGATKLRDDSNFSPLAQYTALTLQEYDQTLRHLRQQHEVIMRKSSELVEMEAAEKRRHQQAAEALRQDELEVMQRLAANKKGLQALEGRSLEEARRRKEEILVEAEERKELEEEVVSLNDVEGELRVMQEKIMKTIEETVERSRLYSGEFTRGLSRLEKDRQECHAVAANVAPSSRLAIGSSSSNDNNGGQQQPMLPHQVVTPRERYVSPPRHPPPLAAAAHHQQGSNAVPFVAQVRGQSPGRSHNYQQQQQQHSLNYDYSTGNATSSVGGGGGGLGPQLYATSPTRDLRSQQQQQAVEHHRIRSNSPPKSRGHQQVQMEAHQVRRPTPPPQQSIAYDYSSFQQQQQQGGGGGRAMTSPQKAGKSNSALAKEQLATPMMAAVKHHSSTAYAQPSSPPPPSATQPIAATIAQSQLREEIARGAEAVTPLHVACAKSRPDKEGVMAILRSNPDMVNHLDPDGNTPLHCACMAEPPSVDIVHALLLAGSNASVLNGSGLSAFHLACLNRADADHRLKKFLLFKGAQNPNMRTGRGETAGHLCAASDDFLETTKFLANRGVDMAAKALLSGPDRTPQQMTPLDVARREGTRAAKTRAFLETLS